MEGLNRVMVNRLNFGHSTADGSFFSVIIVIISCNHEVDFCYVKQK